MPSNPFKENERGKRRLRSDTSLDLARVEEVADDSSHQIKCSIVSDSQEDPFTPTVIVAEKGDISLPSEGDLVLIGYIQGRKAVVIGTVYSRGSSIRDYDADQRTFGHDSTDANITINPDGSINIDPASGQSVDIGGVTIGQPVSNPLSFPYVEWSTANNENEIWRVDLESDEQLHVYRLETKFKGGSTDPNFYIDIYDVDAATIIAQTDDVATGQPIGSSGVGNTVIARLTNDTGGSRPASLSSQITITRGN